MRIGGRRGSCCLSAAEGTPGHGEDGPGASAAVSRGSGSGRAAGGRRRTRPRIPSLPRARRGRRELCARGLAGQALNLAGARGPQGTATALSCGLLLARQRLHRHGTASDIKGSAREEARSRSTLPALMLLTRGVTRAPRSAPGPGPAALRARAAGPPAEPPARGPVPPAISAPSTSCADRPPG
jgi:hypothetical protein